VPAELTSFIGRRHQLQAVKAALTGARLVTLVGPGGVGKTRLALRTASDLRRGTLGLDQMVDRFHLLVGYGFKSVGIQDRL